MLKKFYTAIFIALTILLYFIAASMSIYEDYAKFINNSISDEFYVGEIVFPVDLKGYTEAEIIDYIIELSEKYRVNILFRKEEYSTTSDRLNIEQLHSVEGIDYEVYAYIQNQEIFDNLNVKGLDLSGYLEFNNKMGYFISNQDIENKVGHITTTHPQDTLTMTTLKGYDGHLTGRFMLSSLNLDNLQRFTWDLIGELRDLSPNAFAGTEINSSYFQSQLRRLIETYYRELILLLILLILTSIIYINNEKRVMLIKKVNGYKSLQLYIEYQIKLLLPGLILSLPMFFIYTIIHFKGISPKIFSILALYYILIFICMGIYIVCTSLSFLYIRKLKAVELIQYREENHIFLFVALLAKVVILPILLVTMAITFYNYMDAAQRKGDIELRQELYQDFIHFEYLYPNINIFTGDLFEDGRIIPESYGSRFPIILENKLQAYVYGTGNRYQGMPHGEYVVSANVNLINDSKLIDTHGNTVELQDLGGNYVLIPERFKEDIQNYAKSLPGVGSVESRFTDRDLNPAEVIFIKDDQKMKAFFGGETLAEYNDGYSYNNIIMTPFMVGSPRQIIIDSNNYPNYKKAVEKALAEEGLELLFSIQTLPESYEIELNYRRNEVYRHGRIAIFYSILVAYISSLSIFLYFKTKQKEIYIKTLHGSYVHTNFWDLIALNFLIDGLVFGYLYWIRSYENMYDGHKVLHSLPYVFIFLLILDMVFIVFALQSVKRRNLAQAVKKGI